MYFRDFFPVFVNEIQRPNRRSNNTKVCIMDFQSIEYEKSIIFL